MRILQITLILLLLFTFGCAPSQAEDLAPSEPQAPPAEETQPPVLSNPPSQGDTTEMTPTTPAAAGLENLIERAKEDLAQRLNILLTEISLIDAKAVVWPDASLGCPQPGMLYKQVPEDGALVVLQANGINYEYHNGGTRGLFLCEKVLQKLPPPTQIDLLNLPPSHSEASTPDKSIPPDENK